MSGEAYPLPWAAYRRKGGPQRVVASIKGALKRRGLILRWSYDVNADGTVNDETIMLRAAAQ